MTITSRFPKSKPLIFAINNIRPHKSERFFFIASLLRPHQLSPHLNLGRRAGPLFFKGLTDLSVNHNGEQNVFNFLCNWHLWLTNMLEFIKTRFFVIFGRAEYIISLLRTRTSRSYLYEYVAITVCVVVKMRKMTQGSQLNWEWSECLSGPKIARHALM